MVLVRHCTDLTVGIYAKRLTDETEAEHNTLKTTIG